jgi:ABC-type nitrate/sulfonate/bicarbonate transport system permease component
MTTGVQNARPARLGAVGLGGRPRVRRPKRRRSKVRALVGLAGIVFGLAIWQLLGGTKIVDPLYVSTPVDVVRAGQGLLGEGELTSNALVTLKEWATGFGLAVLVGVPLGMMMGWRLRFRQTLEPLLTALYVTPSLALLPIVVLAFGIDEASKIVLVFIEAVITIIVNSMAGVRETDPRLVSAARSFTAGDLAVFGKVLFPSALPTIVAGLRLGAGRAVIAVILAELYAGTAGLGQLISTYGQNFSTAPLLFLTLLVGAFGYSVSALLRALEVSLTKWKV